MGSSRGIGWHSCTVANKFFFLIYWLIDRLLIKNYRCHTVIVRIKSFKLYNGKEDWLT